MLAGHTVQKSGKCEGGAQGHRNRPPGLLPRPACPGSRGCGFGASSLSEDLPWQQALRSRKEPQPWPQRAGVRVLSPPLTAHPPRLTRGSEYRVERPAEGGVPGPHLARARSPPAADLPALEPEAGSRPGPPKPQTGHRPSESQAPLMLRFRNKPKAVLHVKTLRKASTLAIWGGEGAGERRAGGAAPGPGHVPVTWRDFVGNQEPGSEGQGHRAGGVRC